MRLTTKGRFSLDAMVDVALRESGGPVTLTAVSARQRISLSYLEQLFSKLRRHKLIESTRGPGGGYMLTRPPSEITVADIIFAVDEPVDSTCTGDERTCGLEGTRCLTHDLWKAVNAELIGFLQSVTLQELADRKRADGIAVEDAVPKRRQAIAPMPAAKSKQVHQVPNSIFALGDALRKAAR